MGYSSVRNQLKRYGSKATVASLLSPPSKKGRGVPKRATKRMKQAFKNNIKVPRVGFEARWSRMTKSIQQAISQHNNMSVRSFKWTRRRGAPLKKKVAYKYMSTWDTVVNGSEGIQALGVLKNIGTKFQMLGTTSTARGDPARDADSYYDLNPYRNLTGSAIFPTQAASPGAGYSSDKIMYKYVSGTVSALSMASIAQKVDILWCMCKKDSNDSPIDTWDNILFSMRMGTTPAVPASVTTSTTATPGAGAMTNPGAHPQQLVAWREMWRVIHTERLLLQPGDQVDINFFFRINRLIDKINIDRSVSTYMANYTIVPIVIQLGGLFGIFDTGATATEVTYGATKVGYHVKQIHTFQALPATARQPVTRFYPGAVVGTHTTTGQHVIDTDIVDVGINFA